MRPTCVWKASPLQASEDRDSDARLLIDTVREAGELGRSLSQKTLQRWTKPDGSQVTEGDLAINDLIEKRRLK